MKPKFNVGTFVVVTERGRKSHGMVGKVRGESNIQRADPLVAIRLNRNGRKDWVRYRKLRVATKKDVAGDPIKHKFDKVKLSGWEQGLLNDPW